VAAAGAAEDPVAAAQVAAVEAAWNDVKVYDGACDPVPECALPEDCAADADPCTDAACISGACSQVDNGECAPTCEPTGSHCDANTECCSGTCLLKGKKAHSCT
jgi:hypothetical protein